MLRRLILILISLLISTACGAPPESEELGTAEQSMVFSAAIDSAPFGGYGARISGGRANRCYANQNHACKVPQPQELGPKYDRQIGFGTVPSSWPSWHGTGTGPEVNAIAYVENINGPGSFALWDLNPTSCTSSCDIQFQVDNNIKTTPPPAPSLGLDLRTVTQVSCTSATALSESPALPSSWATCNRYLVKIDVDTISAWIESATTDSATRRQYVQQLNTWAYGIMLGLPEVPIDPAHYAETVMSAQFLPATTAGPTLWFRDDYELCLLTTYDMNNPTVVSPIFEWCQWGS